jgi:hypothetical protein
VTAIAGAVVFSESVRWARTPWQGLCLWIGSYCFFRAAGLLIDIQEAPGDR